MTQDNDDFNAFDYTVNSLLRIAGEAAVSTAKKRARRNWQTIKEAAQKHRNNKRARLRRLKKGATVLLKMKAQQPKGFEDFR